MTQHDLVAARAEDDVAAAVEYKPIEEVFIRQAYVMAVFVAGRKIATTAEHPFYVHDQGWVPAGQLRVGDWVHSHDGQWTPVTAVELTGTPAQVYDFRIADHHTYFVGDDDWGFSVLVHNSKYVPDATDVATYSAQRNSGHVDWDSINPNLTKRQQSAIRRAARSQGVSIPTPNPHGAPGRGDHQSTVASLIVMARGEFPNDIIHQGTSIKSLTGLDRNPDVWVENVLNGQVKKVYEAARMYKAEFVSRELAKKVDYDAAGILSHFEQVK